MMYTYIIYIYIYSMYTVDVHMYNIYIYGYVYIYIPMAILFMSYKEKTVTDQLARPLAVGLLHDEALMITDPNSRVIYYIIHIFITK